jgi:hypothetical protein
MCFFHRLINPHAAAQVATIILQRGGHNEIFDLCAAFCVGITSFYVRVGLKPKVLLPVSIEYAMHPML